MPHHPERTPMKPGLSTARDEHWMTMVPDSYPSCRLLGGPIQLVTKNDAHSFSPGFNAHVQYRAVVVPSASVISSFIDRRIFLSCILSSPAGSPANANSCHPEASPSRWSVVSEPSPPRRSSDAIYFRGRLDRRS